MFSWALRTGRTASVPACPSAWRSPGPNPSHRDLLSPLHYTLKEEVDRLAVEGTNEESEDDDTLYPVGLGHKMFFNWVDHADKSKSHTSCLTVKKHIKAHEEKISWQTKSRKTDAEEYLAGPSAARQQLGVAKTAHKVGGAEAAFIADAISGMDDVGGHSKANKKYREQVTAAKDKVRGE